jgi:hypothetical protein
MLNLFGELTCTLHTFFSSCQDESDSQLTVSLPSFFPPSKVFPGQANRREKQREAHMDGGYLQ